MYISGQMAYIAMCAMDDRLCLLVIVGVTEHGQKELVAVEDGFRESSASWEEVLIKLRQKGLTQGPRLATGDGALGFWNALRRCILIAVLNVVGYIKRRMY